MPDAPNLPADVSAPPVLAGPPSPPFRRRARRRFWLLLAGVALLAGVILYSPLWQGLLRMALTHEAARHGGELSIGRIKGSLFDTFQLYDVRLRQRGPGAVPGGTGTDLRVARVDLVPDWSLARHRATRRSWLREITLQGLSGQCDLSPPPGGSKAAGPFGGPRSWLCRNADRFVPGAFLVRSGELLVRRGRYSLRIQGLRINGSRGETGRLMVQELEIGGPGFQNTFLNRHAETGWQGDRLTVTGMDFAPGVRLASLTLDGEHLGRQHLDWEGNFAILGGEIRAQGGINLSRTQIGLEVAGTLRQLPVQSLARLLGLMGSADGLVQQGSFSFRGNPEDSSAAEMWLAAQATDFRWGRRRWQSLELQTVVLHRRVQVNRLELRQSRNRLSLHGEFPLPLPADGTKGTPGHPWWEAGFSCTVDARLDDLHALSQLVGPRFPELDGRMSINGALEAMPGKSGINGYLNVEGGQLMVRGAPLDYLRSTLIFRGDEMQVADLQATRGGDYFTGKWTTRLSGTPQYAGELRVAVKDRAAYTRALDGWFDLDKVGLASADPHAPVQLDGSFHGPGPNREAVFQAAGATVEPMSIPVPTIGEWWRDD